MTRHEREQPCKKTSANNKTGNAAAAAADSESTRVHTTELFCTNEMPALAMHHSWVATSPKGPQGKVHETDRSLVCNELACESGPSA